MALRALLCRVIGRVKHSFIIIFSIFGIKDSVEIHLHPFEERHVFAGEKLFLFDHSSN
jgi:hypothetical protein